MLKRLREQTMGISDKKMLDDFILEMSYRSYRHNRLLFPIRKPEGYAPVFPNWQILEDLFQKEIKKEVGNEL